MKKYSLIKSLSVPLAILPFIGFSNAANAQEIDNGIGLVHTTPVAAPETQIDFSLYLRKQLKGKNKVKDYFVEAQVGSNWDNPTRIGVGVEPKIIQIGNTKFILNYSTGWDTYNSNPNSDPQVFHKFGLRIQEKNSEFILSHTQGFVRKGRIKTSNWNIKNLETKLYGKYKVKKGLNAFGEVLHHDKLTGFSAGVIKKIGSDYELSGGVYYGPNSTRKKNLAFKTGIHYNFRK